jgi:phosphatidate cytidylyltransferase
LFFSVFFSADNRSLFNFVEKFLTPKTFNLIFCLFISLISQLGDLFVSFIKRKAKVKDTGNILPGHGGILDRVDGIIFAVPFSYFLLRLI